MKLAVQVKQQNSFVLVILLAFCLSPQFVWSLFNDAEQQDGIPVLSARSIDSVLENEQPNESRSSSTRPAHRRQNPDLDDANEEDDNEDDAIRSESVNRESRENPSYGESQRAGRDGDEIESFFDRHLGPPQQEAGPGSASNGEETRQIEVPVANPNDLEAAASGPIANLLHNLIFHRDAVTKAAAEAEAAQSSAESTRSGKKPLAVLSLASGGDSKQETKKGIRDKDTESSEVTRPATGQLEGALLAPMLAAPSSLVAYEPHQSGTTSGSASEETGAQPSSQALDDASNGGGLSEIYIGRRPTVMSFLQQASAQANEQRHHLSSSPQASYYQYPQMAAGSANVWRTPQVVSYQQQMGSQLPVAASYSYNRLQQQQQHYPGATGEMHMAGSQPVEQDGDDEQTATYSLSFGSKSHGSNEADAASSQDEPNGGEYEQQAAVADQELMRPQMLRAQQQYYQQQMAAAGYVPYSSRHRPMHSSSSTSAAYQYQQELPQQQKQQYYRQQPHYGRRAARAGALARAAAQLDAAQATHPANAQDDGSSARYSEQRQTNAAKQGRAKERQKLLASLDQELRSSSAYQQQTQAASLQRAQVATATPGATEDRAESARQPLTASKNVRQSFLGDHLNSYNAIHTEVDPDKSFTTSTQMIPLRSSVQQASNDERDAPKSSAGENSEREQSPTAQSGGEVSSIETNQRSRESNVITGPLSNFDANLSTGEISSQQDVDTVPTKKQTENHLRVRRDDSEDRDDADDDGVWVDDDEDDDNRQQSSDVNETSHEPGEDEEDDTQQDGADNGQVASQISPPGVIGGPHGYELSPNDLMIYNG